MTVINLHIPQTMLYSEFLLALSDEEYVNCINETKVGESLYSGVIAYAKMHYPKITIA